MERNFKNLFGLLGETKGNSTVSVFEETRGGLPKAYIPNFFHKAPFGYPRYKDLTYFRKLAASIYVDMCVTAIIDEVCSVEWDIVAEDKSGNKIEGKEEQVKKVKEFFENPNTNKESWEHIIRMMLPDLLEINSGILIKVFNSFGKMVEIVARNGVGFTKNPDIYGMFTNRADLLLIKTINNEALDSPLSTPSTNLMLGGTMSPDQAREQAAYFQYGFNTAAKPVPFGKREIVWFEKKVRTDDLYGRSAMEVLSKTVQTLIYAVEHNLEYFSDNSIPPGVLGLEGMNTEELKAFASQWAQSQKTKDEFGNWKKAFHKLTMVNSIPKFERLGYTNQELELIESQKWWSKMVWAAFGITATELGFTEDAKGAGNQIVQTSIAKKRIIYPLLRLIEYHVNTEIIPEFEVEGIKYKYKIFDVDEETKKWGLYKLQVDAKLKSINEIRNTEGLEDVEWGDNPEEQHSDDWWDNDGQPSNPVQQDADKINRDSQNERDAMRGDKKKSIDLKDLELKYKYAKRTGSPGHYTYWYRGPGGKLTRGKPVKERILNTEELRKLSEKSLKDNKKYIDLALSKISKDKLELIKDNWYDSINGKSSLDLNSDKKGNFTPKREKEVHKAIYEKYMKAIKVTIDSEPDVVFMAGIPGAGKTYSTRKLFDYSEDGTTATSHESGKKYVIINTDNIKEMLPEYDGGMGSSIVHEESSLLSKKIMALAIRNKSNVIFDGTLSNAESSLSKVDHFNKAGYSAQAIYIDTDVESAIYNAAQRFKRSGRYAHYEMIAEAYPRVRNTIQKLKDKFTNVEHIKATRSDKNWNTL